MEVDLEQQSHKITHHFDCRSERGLSQKATRSSTLIANRWAANLVFDWRVMHTFLGCISLGKILIRILNPNTDFLFLWQNPKKDYESNESVRDEDSVD